MKFIKKFCIFKRRKEKDYEYWVNIGCPVCSVVKFYQFNKLNVKFKCQSCGTKLIFTGVSESCPVMGYAKKHEKA